MVADWLVCVKVSLKTYFFLFDKLLLTDENKIQRAILYLKKLSQPTQIPVGVCLKLSYWTDSKWKLYP